MLEDLGVEIDRNELFGLIDGRLRTGIDEYSDSIGYSCIKIIDGFIDSGTVTALVVKNS